MTSLKGKRWMSFHDSSLRATWLRAFARSRSTSTGKGGGSTAKRASNSGFGVRWMDALIRFEIRKISTRASR